MKLLLIALIMSLNLASLHLHAGTRKFDFTKLATKLINAKGEKTELNLTGKKFILVYYSSHWCSACKSFTPRLVNFYNNNNDGNFEVVFMSLDFSKKSQLAYMRDDKMPWLAVKYSHLKPSGLFEFVGCFMPWTAVFKADGTLVPTNNLSLSNHTADQVLANLKKTISPANTKRKATKKPTKSDCNLVKLSYCE